MNGLIYLFQLPRRQPRIQLFLSGSPSQSRHITPSPYLSQTLSLPRRSTTSGHTRALIAVPPKLSMKHSQPAEITPYRETGYGMVFDHDHENFASIVLQL